MRLSRLYNFPFLLQKERNIIPISTSNLQPLLLTDYPIHHQYKRLCGWTWDFVWNIHWNMSKGRTFTRTTCLDTQQNGTNWVKEGHKGLNMMYENYAAFIVVNLMSSKKITWERAQPPSPGSIHASSRQSLVCSPFERLANDETSSSDVGVLDLLRTWEWEKMGWERISWLWSSLSSSERTRARVNAQLPTWAVKLNLPEAELVPE